MDLLTLYGLLSFKALTAGMVCVCVLIISFSRETQSTEMKLLMLLVVSQEVINRVKWVYLELGIEREW